ncbi:hypothetical protein SKAU_G00365760 [Synaphobranchus kaupii]|uniref:Uncharacterized protein n=1 Tax=Synaphobranchus kaupii TaxID=118154 RepID=A0A9Q1EF23_SYNKA|nr:hypothetical protein SKAU_G00365760 [Synaphobranchus kaupii]
MVTLITEQLQSQSLDEPAYHRAFSINLSNVSKLNNRTASIQGTKTRNTNAGNHTATTRHSRERRLGEGDREARESEGGLYAVFFGESPLARDCRLNPGGPLLVSGEASRRHSALAGDRT